MPLTSLIAPTTVAGVALGFGAQRIVQDLLAGFFIITERQYGFGDLIRISNLGSTTGVTGTVEDVTLRTTRMRTVNGEVVIIPNGQINQVTNLSHNWAAMAVVDIPLPATADINRVNEILQKVGEEDIRRRVAPAPAARYPTVMGVESIDVGTLSTRMVSRTLPGKQFVVGRELHARVATALREAGIMLAADLETSGVPRSTDATPRPEVNRGAGRDLRGDARALSARATRAGVVERDRAGRADTDGGAHHDHHGPARHHLGAEVDVDDPVVHHDGPEVDDREVRRVRRRRRHH